MVKIYLQHTSILLCIMQVVKQNLNSFIFSLSIGKLLKMMNSCKFASSTRANWFTRKRSGAKRSYLSWGGHGLAFRKLTCDGPGSYVILDHQRLLNSVQGVQPQQLFNVCSPLFQLPAVHSCTAQLSDRNVNDMHYFH